MLPLIALSAWLTASALLGSMLVPFDDDPEQGEAPVAVAPALSLHADESAFAAGAREALSEPEPLLGAPSLHNVFRLSEQIISGGEPHDDAGFAAIAALGVRTILSVDGKSPDAAAAAAHGLTYVHVPIRYRGISEDELLRLTKTFREKPGPFYVHCFHGKHRGPAAAAVGRLVVDGASRQQSLAEMRQWCGTSSKYEGLYQTVAANQLPSAAASAAYDWDFPAARAHAGFRTVMVEASRAFETLTTMEKNGWAVPDDHPDIDPVNESTVLASLFSEAAALDDVTSQPDDFRDWIQQSSSQSLALRDVLSGIRRNGGEDWSTADAAYKALKGSCTACHKTYRND
ncbi:MAG: protein tyrosine phosphatase (PTP) superfamily phosphohydrolase (DUF442 family) [Pseudohongiellaceae bacterium]|jgi:protein tyrosine phosphatase (PTP) superfamily phosphohydrolase (DUF442 family)